MDLTNARRGFLAAATAVLLCLAVPGAALAAGWSAPIVVDPEGSLYGGDLLALSPFKLVLLYVEEDPNDDYGSFALRRSTNGGETWSSPQQLGPGSFAMSGTGNFVDLVWLLDGRLRYSRSTNSGASFPEFRVISPPEAHVSSFKVARGPNDDVAIVWHLRQDRSYSRVSTDGGRSFGPIRLVSRGRNVNLDDLAIGNGVVYLAYENPQYWPGYESHLKVKRSLDNGLTWSAAIAISDEGELGSLAAEGTTAYLAYTEWVYNRDQSSARFTTVQYRASFDAGTTWSKPRQLAPHSWDSDKSSIVLDDGVLHALLARCDPTWDTCDNERVTYRRSSDGLTWSPPERVSPKGNFFDAYIADVAAYDGRVFASYTGYTWTDSMAVVQIRNP
jgi:hypothetical protein